MTSRNIRAELGDPCNSSTAGLDASPAVVKDNSVPPDSRSRCGVAWRITRLLIDGLVPMMIRVQSRASQEVPCRITGKSSPTHHARLAGSRTSIERPRRAALHTQFHISDQAPFGEGQAAVVADDEMVEHTNVHERERVAQTARDELIGLARLRDARRVVVREDERRGVVLQRLAHDLARMNAGTVDGAAKHLFEMNEPVAVVEMQATEHFVGPIAQLSGEELACGRRGIHGGTGA